MDEHAASFRWLTASLFAANGGALIALVGSDNVPDFARVWAGFWFTVGIMFSLLTAWFNQRLVGRMIEPMANLIAFWGCIAHGMEFDESKHSELIAAVKNSTNRSWPIQTCGWIAAAVFLFGMVAAGAGFWSNSKNKPIVHLQSTPAK